MAVRTVILLIQSLVSEAWYKGKKGKGYLGT